MACIDQTGKAWNEAELAREIAKGNGGRNDGITAAQAGYMAALLIAGSTVRKWVRPGRIETVMLMTKYAAAKQIDRLILENARM